MRQCVYLAIVCCILTGLVSADVSWNVNSGYWATGTNWDSGRIPDATDSYINIRYSNSSVCTLNTNAGLFAARLIMQNGQTLNITSGGSVGLGWSRVGRATASTVNMSGNGTFIMNDDDLYIGLEDGSCQWTMSGTSSLIVAAATAGGDELYIAEDGGTGLLKLIGSDVTVQVDAIHLGVGTAGTLTPQATVEFVLDAGGASTIKTGTTNLAEAGNAYLVISVSVTPPQSDMVLIEATGTGVIGGNGVFDTLNGGPAVEGTMLVLDDNVYALTYQYDAAADGHNNDVALVFQRTAEYAAHTPTPAHGAVLGMSPLTLSWTNPLPLDGVSPITCDVYFGKEMNRLNMDKITLSPNVSAVSITAADFPTYGSQPLDDLAQYYWIVDCIDGSAGADPADGQGIFWSFSTDYSLPPDPYATEPSPAVGNGVDPAGLVLSWLPGEGSLRSEVYLGMDASAVANAQKSAGDVDGDGITGFSDLLAMAGQWLMSPADPCPDLNYNGLVDMPDFARISEGWQDSADSAYLGAASGSTFNPGTLNLNTTYYWRVDSVFCDRVEPGLIWNFQTKPPAFAEGFGKNVTGGRGGTVYHVTNLNDSGSGSLRNAGTLSNVTIVFDVGGYINISSKLGFTGSNVTVAGQTAPGGIGIKGAGCSIGADNIIIRHVRFRPGKATSASDALNINSYVSGCVVDHCSIQFSTDENNSMDKPAATTVQWTINGWGLQTHSCGSLLYANNTTVHHTLWAHNHTRNPKSRDGLLDWINNTVFDWDIPYICADADSGTHWANVDRCYFISGASGQSKAFTSAQLDAGGNPTYHMWLNQTLTDFDTDGILDGTDKGYSVISGTVEQVASRYSAAPQVDTQDATTAYKLVLSLAGSTPWARDEVDTLLVSDVINQTRRIIERESDLPGISNSGFGTLGGQSASADTDADGMPDYFETALGMSPTVASNNGDHDGDGITNLEEYLDWLGKPHASTTANTAVDIDLKKFTAGFASNASYSVFGAFNGSVTLLADGKTAHFTPATTLTGFAGFNFTVNDGSVATISISVLVLGQGTSNPPSPDPMTWTSVPAATGVQSIAMQAATASSANGVQYYFTCTGGGGHDSGWQSGTSYTDTGLTPNTQYTYTVKARDVVSLNETSASVPASATTLQLPAVAVPRAHWKFDETSGLTASDASGNGNIGTLQGTIPPAWTAGKYGNALTFGGTTDGGVYVPSSSTIDFADQDMSVSFWLKEPTTMADGQEEVLIKGTISSPGTGKRYEFYHKKTTTANDFRFAIDDNVVKSEISRSSTAFCADQWVHVTGVRDTIANQLRLYANGVLQGTAADSTGSISQTEPLYIGDAIMVGSIDDVQIFNAALTADQVYALYLGDTTAPAAPGKLSAAGGNDIVWLNWYANTESDLGGYNVSRAETEGGPYTIIAAGLTSNTYTDSNVSNGMTYYYVVTAVDTSNNESSYSNEAAATPETTDITPPGIPTNLTAAAGANQISLNWDDNTEADLAGYNVKRSTTSGGPYDTVAAQVTDSDYLDNTVTAGTTYYYVVTAVDTSSNESDVSNEASAAP